MAGRFRNELSPGEKRLLADYRDESSRLQQQAMATFDPAEKGEDSPRARWIFKEGDYERDDGLRRDLLNRYFSEKFRQFHATVAQSDADFLEQSHINERAALAGKGLTEWQKMTPAERRRETTYLLEVGALLALFVLRETRRFGVRAGDPPVIAAGFRRYKLGMRAGVVANYRSWVETTTTITERINDWGQVLSRSEQSSSTHHEAFDLVGAEGSTPVHVTGAGLRANNGDALSAMSAARRGRKQGQWILLRNHTQNDRLDHAGRHAGQHAFHVGLDLHPRAAAGAAHRRGYPEDHDGHCAGGVAGNARLRDGLRVAAADDHRLRDRAFAARGALPQA
ncbi:MAG: hypothetical protein WDO12_10265 [Pseudomonadota bacterium]